MGEIIPLHADPHEEAQLLLPWYVTGQADAASLARVERHLAGCAVCRAELAFERALHAAIARDAAPVTTRPAVTRRWVPLARAAAAVLAFVALMPSGAPAPAPYRALGSTPTAPSGNLLIMVRPGTGAAGLRAVVAQSGARLIDGPTAAGAYVLSVAPGERARALARLRAQAMVSLAEPIDAGPPG